METLTNPKWLVLIAFVVIAIVVIVADVIADAQHAKRRKAEELEEQGWEAVYAEEEAEREERRLCHEAGEQYKALHPDAYRRAR